MDNNGNTSLNAKSLQFTDLFDLAYIQKLQDLFADAHGVASIITNPEGLPIAKPVDFKIFAETLKRLGLFIQILKI
ncbi:MAG: PocR ligand-binding domain-containing protein [Salinivirgaceae bacterium]|nr:PocR ligand-binding domain-containing protein [Salinivirgaceae bacterium]